MTEKLKFVLGRVENIAGKGKNAGYQLFSFFHNAFNKHLSQGRYKSGLCGKGLNVFYVAFVLLESTALVILDVALDNF